MNQAPNPGQVKRFIAKINSHFKALENQEGERRRKRTQKIVDEMSDKSTPEARKAAAAARARATYTKIDDTNAQADLKSAQNQISSPAIDLDKVRIDDLETLFSIQDQLPLYLQERIKKIRAKIHWQTRKGHKAYFNVAVNVNNIPIDRHLTTLAHLKNITDGGKQSLDGWLDSVIECGLFPKVKKGIYKKGRKVAEEHMFHYSRRCQDAEHCILCNWVNISDGLKILLESYDESAFYRAGNMYAITVAPRDDRAKAQAVGRNLTPGDWQCENPDSIVFRESHQGRIFKFPDATDSDQYQDWHVESVIRRFLGAVQYVFGKLVKNGWLDGIRAKVENSIEFLPFASHQHWHGVGSSRSEHDPQKFADYIKTEVDKMLAQTCPGLYADVMVAVIPSPQDLAQWIGYINKTVDLVGPMQSVYNRYPGLRRSDQTFIELSEELRRYPERSRGVFGLIRDGPYDERGAHTYMLWKRYVRGNHKFGKGSILSEPERHREWRESHATNEAESRRLHRLQDDAGRLGFRVVKCPKRFPEAEGYGTYHVVNIQSKAVVAAGPSGHYGLSLGECAKFIKRKSKG